MAEVLNKDIGGYVPRGNFNPLNANFTKWSNTQTICRQIADELFECV